MEADGEKDACAGRPSRRYEEHVSDKGPVSSENSLSGSSLGESSSFGRSTSDTSISETSTSGKSPSETTTSEETGLGNSGLPSRIEEKSLSKVETERRASEDTTSGISLSTKSGLGKLSESTASIIQKLNLEASASEKLSLLEACSESLMSTSVSMRSSSDERSAKTSPEEVASSKDDPEASVRNNSPEIHSSKDAASSSSWHDFLSREWNSTESSKTKSAARKKSTEELAKPKTSEGSFLERRRKRRKEKRSVGSLRMSLEKKVGTVEKMLEDRVEKIIEENVEKYPWLQPIESWIADRCKFNSASYSLPHEAAPCVENAEVKEAKEEEVKERLCEVEEEARQVEQKTADIEERLRELEQRSRRAEGLEAAFDFKFTAASREDEEPKFESRLIENLKLRRRDAARLERSGFDPATLIHRLKKMEPSTATSNSEDHLEDPRVEHAIPPDGILDVKEAKHHNYDLFDKLRDNVKGKMEDIHRYFQRTNRLADVNRRLKSQIWSSVVTIVLVEAKNLLPMDIDGLSDPYVKFRLGTEKYKSKVVNKSLNPVWLEQFDLHLYEDPYLGQELEVTVWDRDRSHQDDLMGRAVIDLAVLERETTHRLWRELEDGSGSIFLLLTISGTTASETISDLAAHEETPHERALLLQRYALINTLQRPRDVGHLTVKVYRAQGLAAADLGGKSDPFCVLELVNSRLQTQTEYKTLAPNWQKIFTFNVKDINSVLEVTVYDEDRDHKVEFLGKVAIPLLRIRNGEKRWYALKDKKLRGRAKGNSPQILLELTVVWNILRACIRTLNPKEKKYMEPEQKFKRQVFLRNVLRLKAIIVSIIDLGKYIQSCWEWESKTRSIVALVIFVLGCYYFEPYMFPLLALLILLKYYLLTGERSGLNGWICGQVAAVTGAPLSHQAGLNLHDAADMGVDECPPTPGDDDDDEDDKDKEEKKSLKERLQAIQEVTQIVQNSIGYIASLCERVKNLFNFTVPYLSYLAILLAILCVCVLYLIPVRYLILAWGVNKFSRKVLRPHSVPNNEILDLVSRVPDDEELLNYRELKPAPTGDCDKGAGPSGSGSGNSARREQRKRHKAA